VQYNGAMEDWKKLADHGKQILSEEETRREEEGIAEAKIRKKEREDTLRSLKPNEYIPEYEKNIRGYFLIKKPFGETTLHFQSSSMYFADQDEDSPRIPQIGAFTLEVEIPVPVSRGSEFSPALRFAFIVSQREPYIIEYNRCYSMNYVLSCKYSYPRKFKRFFLAMRGVINSSQEVEISFSLIDMKNKDQLIDYLSGQFISIIQKGFDRFIKETRIL
jgi:hypothetical protein